MNVIKLHKCQQCGKIWYPRKPGTPKICPTCKMKIRQSLAARKHERAGD